MNYKELKERGLIIFECVAGSKAYGTNTPTSDTDIRYVYQQPNEDILAYNKYTEQVSDDTNDCVGYEIKRFLELISQQGPNCLEILYSPNDCIIKTTPQFQLLIDNREKFLTKKCLLSFGGYATSQIKKAKGLDKKMNWENSRVQRKTPIDFVYYYENGKTIPLTKWLTNEGKKQENCGLVALNHFKDCFSVYYDYNAHNRDKNNKEDEILGFKGFILDDSNSVRLSSVPKDMKPEIIVCFNKDGYSKHCKDYREYQTWLNNRNTQRYVDVKNHNQQIDGKNLLHCRRLFDTAMEIAREKTINVKRPNADYLLSIRRGEVPLDDIISQAEKDLESLNELFKKSDLPDECDDKLINDLLLKIRNYENNKLSKIIWWFKKYFVNLYHINK